MKFNPKGEALLSDNSSTCLRLTNASVLGVVNYVMAYIVIHAAKLSTHTTKPSRRLNSFYYDDDDYDYEESTIPLSEIASQIPPSIVITTSPLVLSTEDPEDSLIMGNEDLNTIPKKESDEFIKFSVEDLVPILKKGSSGFVGLVQLDLFVVSFPCLPIRFFGPLPPSSASQPWLLSFFQLGLASSELTPSLPWLLGGQSSLEGDILLPRILPTEICISLVVLGISKKVNSLFNPDLSLSYGLLWSALAFTMLMIFTLPFPGYHFFDCSGGYLLPGEMIFLRLRLPLFVSSADNNRWGGGGGKLMLSMAKISIGVLMSRVKLSLLE
nr:hypothetical protein [Tanacetum cinerariifolium]